MANGPRDGWGRFDITAKALSSVLLPLIILWAGNSYTKQQKQADDARLEQEKKADDARRDTDRVTLLLTHLASTNPKERIIAVKFIEYLSQAHQFPEGLLPGLLSVVNDEDESVAHAASNALTQAITTNPELGTSVEKAAQTNSETKKTVVRAAELSPDLGRVIDVKKIQRATIQN
jgi:hypothetical protein